MLNTFTNQQVDSRLNTIRETTPYRREFDETSCYQYSANKEIYLQARDAKNTAVINNLMLEQILKNQNEIITNQEKMIENQEQLKYKLDLKV